MRHARRLAGVGAVDARASGTAGVRWPDEIGVSPSLSPKFPNISVPYGALVPARAGRAAGAPAGTCPATPQPLFMREIPQCWLTGQAAGVAAALAADQGVMPRAVPVRDIQRALLRQGAHLSGPVAALAAA